MKWSSPLKNYWLPIQASTRRWLIAKPSADTKLGEWVQRRTNTTYYSFGAPYKEGAFMKRDGFALSFKEWTEFGSAESTGKGSTDKRIPRLNTKGHPWVKGLLLSVHYFFTDVSLGDGFLLGIRSLPSTKSDMFCHILFHITAFLFCCCCCLHVVYGGHPVKSPAGWSAWGAIGPRCSLTLKWGLGLFSWEKASHQMPLELRLETEHKGFQTFTIAYASSAAATSEKGDSDPFLEFVIPLYFVTDCEELCDAKYTI